MVKAPVVVLQNFAAAASGYFGGIRVPASIISGTCLGAIFALPNFSSDENRTPTEKFLIKVYRLLTWSAFTLSLNVVITCTIASVTILHGRFDPMAETGYLLLKREFEYEFILTRWSFAVSLFLFITVVTIRVLLEFNLLKDKERGDTAKFVGFSSIALLAHLLSDFNKTLFCYAGLWEMTNALFWIIVKRALDEATMVRGISIFFSIVAICFGCKSIFFGIGNGKEKRD